MKGSSMCFMLVQKSKKNQTRKKKSKQALGMLPCVRRVHGKGDMRKDFKFESGNLTSIFRKKKMESDNQHPVSTRSQIDDR